MKYFTLKLQTNFQEVMLAWIAHLPHRPGSGAPCKSVPSRMWRNGLSEWGGVEHVCKNTNQLECLSPGANYRCNLCVWGFWRPQHSPKRPLLHLLHKRPSGSMPLHPASYRGHSSGSTLGVPTAWKNAWKEPGEIDRMWESTVICTWEQQAKFTKSLRRKWGKNEW